MNHTPWQMFSQRDQAEFWATLALKHTQGIGPRTIARLLKYFGSAYASLENKDFWPDAEVSCEKARLLSGGAWRSTALEEWHTAQRSHNHILLWHHEEYPKSLRQLIDAPPLLYYHGNISLMQGPKFAIVGSRKCSAEGVQVAGNIARDLSKAGISIVSGAAQGIDRVAHVAALAHVGKSIAVLGCGLNVIYPQRNADIFSQLQHEGLLLSEFPDGTPPLTSNFPVRNRIVSGLCLGVLVVEGMLQSGSLITARRALEQNREVYAIPGAATASLSRGCQELIRQGAKPVFNADDILQDLAMSLQEYLVEKAVVVCENPEPEAVEQSEVSSANGMENFSLQDQEVVQKILRYLHAHGEVHIDALCTETNKSASAMNILLIEMEILGYVKKLSGGRVAALKA